MLPVLANKSRTHTHPQILHTTTTPPPPSRLVNNDTHGIVIFYCFLKRGCRINQSQVVVIIDSRNQFQQYQIFIEIIKERDMYVFIQNPLQLTVYFSKPYCLYSTLGLSYNLFNKSLGRNIKCQPTNILIVISECILKIMCHLIIILVSNSPKITLCISRSQDTLIRIWYSPALEYTKSDSQAHT